MIKYIKVVKLAVFYFKKGFETLWRGLRYPDKFQEEERLTNELLASMMPLMVWLSMNRSR